MYLGDSSFALLMKSLRVATIRLGLIYSIGRRAHLLFWPSFCINILHPKLHYENRKICCVLLSSLTSLTGRISYFKNMNIPCFGCSVFADKIANLLPFCDEVTIFWSHRVKSNLSVHLRSLSLCFCAANVRCLCQSYSATVV